MARVPNGHKRNYINLLPILCKTSSAVHIRHLRFSLRLHVARTKHLSQRWHGRDAIVEFYRCCECVWERWGDEETHKRQTKMSNWITTLYWTESNRFPNIMTRNRYSYVVQQMNLSSTFAVAAAACPTTSLFFSFLFFGFSIQRGSNWHEWALSNINISLPRVFVVVLARHCVDNGHRVMPSTICCWIIFNVFIKAINH